MIRIVGTDIFKVDVNSRLPIFAPNLSSGWDWAKTNDIRAPFARRWKGEFLTEPKTLHAGEIYANMCRSYRGMGIIHRKIVAYRGIFY